MVNQTNDPRWIYTLPDDIAGSITSTLRALANALRGHSGAQALDAITRELESSATAFTTRRPPPPSGSSDRSRGSPTCRPVNLAGNSIGDSIAKVTRHC